MFGATCCISSGCSYTETILAAALMDEIQIGPILAETSELISKVVSSIQKGCNVEEKGEAEEAEASPGTEIQEQDDEETGSLLRIKDALKSIESELVPLQELQQLQWYVRESVIGQLKDSWKKLIKELKDYKGKDLQVIREAIVFAGVTDDDNNLPLPPYPSRPPRAVISDNGDLQSFLPTDKSTPIVSITGGLKNLQESEGNERQPVSRSPFQWVKDFLGTTAKTALTVVGVMTVLHLAGFKLQLRKRDNNQFKPFYLMNMQGNYEKENMLECPPGKVPVIENGEMWCDVKES